MTGSGEKSRLEKLEENIEGARDGLVRANEEITKLKANVKWGFIALGAMMASPRVGGPSAHEVIGALIHLI